MGIKRTVTTDYWTDSVVMFDMDSDDKLLYLFLLTNPNTNVIGCYECDVRYMEQMTGMDDRRVKAALEHLWELGRVEYDEDTREVLIPRWPDHNWSASPKLDAAIEKAIPSVKSERFAQRVIARYDARGTVSRPYGDAAAPEAGGKQSKKHPHCPECGAMLGVRDNYNGNYTCSKCGGVIAKDAVVWKKTNGRDGKG